MKTWKDAYIKMSEIASEAIVLADAYAGGESESATALNKKFERLQTKVENDFLDMSPNA